jgi:hypothetical protein
VLSVAPFSFFSPFFGFALIRGRHRSFSLLFLFLHLTFLLARFKSQVADASKKQQCQAYDNDIIELHHEFPYSNLEHGFSYTFSKMAAKVKLLKTKTPQIPRTIAEVKCTTEKAAAAGALGDESGLRNPRPDGLDLLFEAAGG